MEHYDSHPLVDDSDDKKRLEKAEREAERAANKRKRGGGAGAKRKHSWNYTSGLWRHPPCYHKDSSSRAFWDLASAVGDLDTWLRPAKRSQCIILISLW